MDPITRNNIFMEHMNLINRTMHRNRPLLYALHLDPDDVYQELAIAALQAIDSFDARRCDSVKVHIWAKLQYTILDIKRQYRPHGLTPQGGSSRPSAWPLDLLGEDRVPPAMDDQKIFYSALFNYMRTMSWQEMVKLMPFFLNYVETDISPLQCAALGVSVLGVPNENITMGTLPVILNQSAYYGSSQVVPVAIPETAVCLNTYFRPAEAPVSEGLLNIPVLNGITEPVVDCEMKQIGSGGTVTDAPAETADSTSGAQAGSGAAAPAA